MHIDSDRARLAMDVIDGRPATGIPTWLINPMEWEMIDRLAGAPPGSYRHDPIATYTRMQERSGVCMVDQWIPENPLTIGAHGYESGTDRNATTGAQRIVADGRPIESPEDVAAHLEQVAIPRWRGLAESFDANALRENLLRHEADTQAALGKVMLKVPYSFPFPVLDYGIYGYEHYFTAYAVYPEVVEQAFAACADYCVLANRAAATLFRERKLLPYARLDHDMASAGGTLVDVTSLDRLWFPHFARSIAPLIDAGVRAIWHCDGNLMQMVPRLIEAGIQGFQGFEYEHGMDYTRICRMKTRDGNPLLIVAGVSVTRTLPHGTPSDVRKEMAWLVENGPKDNLVLGCSSSIVPGVPWPNLEALVEGFHHYRTTARA